MLIRFSKAKRPDKRDILTCLRDDGTSTWMHERPGLVRHDLVHYAVETTLGYRVGFFGLVASGWDLQAFGHDPDSGERLPMPGTPEAPVEYVVSLFQQERRGVLRPADFGDALALYCPSVAPTLTDERRAGVRARIEDLFRQWDAVPPGGALELPFSVPPSVPS